MPHSSFSVHHLESAHLPLTDSVPLAKLSPGSQTPSSPGDWESAFAAGGWEAGGEGMGRPIPPAPQTHTPARDTCSGSPPCSLLSGRISTLKDETGAVSRAELKWGGGLRGGTEFLLNPAICPVHPLHPFLADLHRQGPHRLRPYPQLPAYQRVGPQVGMENKGESPTGFASEKSLLPFRMFI